MTTFDSDTITGNTHITGVRVNNERTKAGATIYSTVISALIVGIGLLFINLYSINKGFSLWDESYYLLSYAMAEQGFYRHFNNTPFVVAFVFEKFNPGLIGYRAIHMALNIASMIFFSYSVIKYVEASGRTMSTVSRALLFSLAFFGAMYVYPISIATLSYNHLNEFFVLSSEALLLLAMAGRNIGNDRRYLLFLSGFVLVFGIYIKPTTFISILLAYIIFLISSLPDKKSGAIYLSILLAGCLLSFGLSLIVFYSPSQWTQYLALMSSQQAHSPYKVLSSFLGSAVDMLKAGSGPILCGVAVSVWAVFAFGRWTRTRQDRYVNNFITALLLILNAYLAFRFFFPSDLWASFQVHWWYWWVYSSTTLVIVTIVNLGLGLAILFREGVQKNKAIILLLILLTANPIAMGVGTLNGFGQVQIHATSWLLLCGLVSIISLKIPSQLASLYSSLLTLIFIAVAVVYFYRQQLPLNFAGNGAIYDQKYPLKELPLLQNIFVDKPTHDLLMQVKTILDKYPHYPTLVFFDMPGLQYAFGRRWVVPDPWLTNYEYPLTKDNAYNCSAITGNRDKLRETVFIVSNEKDIDPELRSCLAKIGFPEEMKLIGQVSTKVGGLKDPISIYLHP